VFGDVDGDGELEAVLATFRHAALCHAALLPLPPAGDLLQA
jgi:hypothetical protein